MPAEFLDRFGQDIGRKQWRRANREHSAGFGSRYPLAKMINSTSN
jgi:hypothetical protein